MRLFIISATLITCMFAVGCKQKSTTPEASAESTAAPAVSKEEYIANHPSLPQLDIDCINDATPRIGMQATTLAYLLGAPDVLENVDAAMAESVELVYASQGKIYIVEDQGGGTVIVVGMKEYMSEQ